MRLILRQEIPGEGPRGSPLWCKNQNESHFFFVATGGPEVNERIDGHNIHIGYEYTPFEFLVTPELNQQYLYAEEDFHQRYIEETKDGPPIVHPALLLNMSNDSRSPSFSLPPGVAGLHARDEVSFYNLAKVGKKIRVVWKMVDSYEKRGRLYKVIHCLVTDEDGHKIMARLSHVTFTVRQRSEREKGE